MSTAAERNARTCRHFTGIQNVCQADIDPMPLRQLRSEMSADAVALLSPGLPAVWPCTNPSLGHFCGSHVLPTAEEAAAEEAETQRLIVAVLGGLCPTCSKPLDVYEDGNVQIQSCKEHGFVSRGCKRAGGP